MLFTVSLLSLNSCPKLISVASHLVKTDQFPLSSNTILYKVLLAPQYSATINDSVERISLKFFYWNVFKHFYQKTLSIYFILGRNHRRKVKLYKEDHKQ